MKTEKNYIKPREEKEWGWPVGRGSDGRSGRGEANRNTEAEREEEEKEG